MRKRKSSELWRVVDTGSGYALYYKNTFLGEGLTEEDLYCYFVDYIKEGGDATEPLTLVLGDKQEHWRSLEEYLQDDIRSQNTFANIFEEENA